MITLIAQHQFWIVVAIWWILSEDPEVNAALNGAATTLLLLFLASFMAEAMK